MRNHSFRFTLRKFGKFFVLAILLVLAFYFLSFGDDDNLLEFKIDTYSQELDLSYDSFSKPIILTLKDNRGLYNVLPTFAFVDFQNNKMNYVITYSEENMKILDNHPMKSVFSRMTGPHSIVAKSENEMFIFYYPATNYIGYINLEKKLFKIMDSSKLDLEDILSSIGETAFKGWDNPDEFYFTGRVKENSNIAYYRSDLDMDVIEKLGEFSIDSKRSAPHSVREFNGLLLITEPNTHSINLLDYDKKVLSLEEAKEIVAPDLEDDAFVEFFLNDVNYEMVPSGMISINLESGKLDKYTSTSAFAGHFEIDPEEKAIYLSNHNLVAGKTWGVTLLAPGTYDKFLIKDDNSLEYVKTFEYEKGFRYTSHRIFKMDGKPYFVTFSYPNRLLVVDGDTMELEYYDDIEEDGVVDTQIINNGINPKRDDLMVSALEVSDDGRFLFFLNKNHFYVYDLVERKVLEKSEYPKGDNIIDRADYGGQSGLHIQYLDY